MGMGLVCSRRLGRAARVALTHPLLPLALSDAQERSRAAAGLTRRQSVLDSVSAARSDQQRVPLRREHRPGSTEAAEGYKLLQLLLGEGPLASLVLWCYRRRHGVPAEAVLTHSATQAGGLSYASAKR